MTEQPAAAALAGIVTASAADPSSVALAEAKAAFIRLDLFTDSLLSEGGGSQP
ncbi:hypothetical protein Acy02nite_91450 [Actinoplanes cyaneus]|uniref:Uncharacterized protein n=1 Tax=Actinoplanes cyaneus TaxID=52696 RepID=A0A919ISD8_9ACTN|nr:hypothetical protein Acy02nite_91450 [Actinoplanes cyaneus]